ncbi:hypothetical protein EYF80_037165 [Liparis tanakae]|uniref:Uncharacterized protein n=1 Tax=Liparis tanakae TaxID=230148 RepID=A0A4Z2GHL9_9TELE|nr:hypothetical protein EYF80_037165 [Liparis tanakae]
MKASMKRADRRRWVDVVVLGPAWLRYPCSPSNSSHLPTAAESESKKDPSRPRRLSLNLNNFSGYASLNTYAELYVQNKKGRTRVFTCSLIQSGLLFFTMETYQCG